jgi:hypothetical protein
METIRAVASTPDEKAYAYSLIDAALRAHQAVTSAGEARPTNIKRFEAKKILNGEERVAERLVYTRGFDTIATDQRSNVANGLLSAMEDKRLEVIITAVAKAQADAQFKADKPRPYRTDKPSRANRANTRLSLRTAREAAPSPLPTRHTRRLRPARRNDGVTRRTDCCTPDSNYMRHRVRRKWQEWKDIGASGQVLKWIREGVTTPILNN